MNIKVKLSLAGNLKHFGKSAGDIVTVPFEDYIKAVVASEVGNAPLEACRAQAVAARTFAYPSARDGRVITDTGAHDQAFIAARMTNASTYPNAIKGVEDTKGEVLTFEGRHIGKTAHYSSANNGSTKNSRYKWPNSSDQPYLVLRPDQWTYQELQRREAAKERIRYGHGVGLSQYGTMFAAKQGVGYKEILNFYYPGTQVVSAYGQAPPKEETTSMDTANLMIDLALADVGGAYVFGALGEKCTPNNRSAYARSKPAHAASITKACQVLNGSRPSCSGCRYNGKRIFDCRGFTRVMVTKATGRTLMGGGATSQWNDESNWAEKGPMATLPDKPCVLFNRSSKDPKVMSHTGLYDGKGRVIQSGGYGGTGVHVGPLRPEHWTDWAIPVLLYPTNGQGGKPMTLSRGSSGAAVRTLQAALVGLNYTLKPTRSDPRGIDGIFGQDTENVVRLFQINNGLKVDGSWKEADQAKMNSLLGAGPPPPADTNDKAELVAVLKRALQIAEGM